MTRCGGRSRPVYLPKPPEFNAYPSLWPLDGTILFYRRIFLGNVLAEHAGMRHFVAAGGRPAHLDIWHFS